MQEGTVFMARPDQLESTLESIRRILVNLNYQDATGAPMVWEIEVRPAVLPEHMRRG